MDLYCAEWIWINKESGGDEYGEFFDSFFYSGGTAIIGISCRNNYALYINEELAAFGQYADFPWYKVYDEVDLTKYLSQGDNSFRIVVWHYGKDDSSVSYVDRPCLIFEVQVNCKTVVHSSKNTLCRIAAGYVSGRKKKLTPQLGYSFCYDTGATGGEYERAVQICERGNLTLRPVKRLKCEPLAPGKLINSDKRIYDLGRERAGLLYIRFKAPKYEVVIVSFGEHIIPGQVRRIIGKRDFSVEVIGNGEVAEYLNPFRRLGCRYLQIDCGDSTIIEEIGLYETPYPITKRSFKADTPLRQRIYDTAVRTLHLCMHEHYEDTPWREQALYALDSRNQMLFGSAAFHDGLEFQRASLKLMAEDRRVDGLLTICAPCSIDLAIPSFSLWFIVAVREYTERSNDKTLAAEYFDKLTSLVKVFLEREENGLIRRFVGQPGCWDFYEWSDGLDGRRTDEPFDAVLQFICVMALKSMSAICGSLDKATQAKECADMANKLSLAANSFFYRVEKGLYETLKNGNHYSELVNALAVLCGAAEGEFAQKICDAIITGDSLTESTLSMKCFIYDALIKTNKQKYAQHILKDIDARYGRMLYAGATSLWETEMGEADFSGAGSLCHGWSAAPVYYYKLLSSK